MAAPPIAASASAAAGTNPARGKDVSPETLRAQTGRDVGQMKAQFASNAGTVVSTMLGHVAAVNLEVPAARAPIQILGLLLALQLGGVDGPRFDQARIKPDKSLRFLEGRLGHAQRGHGPLQIGRASCRERV